MTFTGEYSARLDAKNRLVIPSKIRESINVQAEGPGWYVVPGFTGTLSLYTPVRFEELASREKAQLFRLEDVRNYDRLHFALSAHLEMDRLGRILIPEKMLRRTAIGKEVAVIGVRDHLEVWDAERWEKFVATNLAGYDGLARSAYDAERQDRAEPSSGEDT